MRTKRTTVSDQADREKSMKPFVIADNSLSPQHLVVYTTHDEFIKTCKKRLNIQDDAKIIIYAEINRNFVIIYEDSILTRPDNDLLIISVGGEPISQPTSRSKQVENDRPSGSDISLCNGSSGNNGEFAMDVLKATGLNFLKGGICEGVNQMSSKYDGLTANMIRGGANACVSAVSVGPVLQRSETNNQGLRIATDIVLGAVAGGCLYMLSRGSSGVVSSILYRGGQEAALSTLGNLEASNGHARFFNGLSGK